MSGKYQIMGNMIYIELDDDIEIGTDKNIFTFKKIILLCGSEDCGAIISGFVFLKDSLRAIYIARHVDAGV